MENLEDYLILMYGERKIGKTSLWSRFPDAFFLMCDPGGKALRLYQPMDEEGKPKAITTWNEFKGYVDALEDSKFGPFIVDTADRAYELCFDHMCKNVLYLDHPADADDYGKSWGQINAEFMHTIERLISFGRGVVLLSHAVLRKSRIDKAERLQCSLSGSIGDKITGIVDVWGYYGYEGPHRYWQIRGEQDIDAGCRLEEHFQNTDGSPIKRIYMGTSADEARDNLLKAYRNETVRSPAARTPSRPAKRGKKRG